MSPWRGTLVARREEGAHWACVTEEQRCQTGCPARELFRELLLQDTRTSLRERDRVRSQAGDHARPLELWWLRVTEGAQHHALAALVAS